ncbi:hypothetical protein LshimejAT787_0601420 [Lyophyllum shimeji]|uniref:Uncharacterized protein n=1 Tax=Lyophyllum shimeji TaxID=47721 RepID=A0A9P3UPG6_LYOSH|nr:hypothetical protein LshimejAT787_0601420 [Lyophyllum shimeji]
MSTPDDTMSINLDTVLFPFLPSFSRFSGALPPLFVLYILEGHSFHTFSYLTSFLFITLATMRCALKNVLLLCFISSTIGLASAVNCAPADKDAEPERVRISPPMDPSRLARASVQRACRKVLAVAVVTRPLLRLPRRHQRRPRHLLLRSSASSTCHHLDPSPASDHPTRASDVDVRDRYHYHSYRSRDLVHLFYPNNVHHRNLPISIVHQHGGGGAVIVSLKRCTASGSRWNRRLGGDGLAGIVAAINLL